MLQIHFQSKLSGMIRTTQTLYKRTLSTTRVANSIIKVDETPRVVLHGGSKSTSLDPEDYLFGAVETRRDFAACGVNHSILTEGLQSMGMHTATAVQAAAIELVLTGQDTVIGAETGSGKTLAYLLPVLQACLQAPLAQGIDEAVRAIVLVPNNELAEQVQSLASRLLMTDAQSEESEIPDTESVAHSARLQIHARRLGAMLSNTGHVHEQVLVCTPGTFRSLVSRELNQYGKTSPLLRLKHLILDEADLLLEGSYVREISHALGTLSAARKEASTDMTINADLKSPQVILSAATIPTYGERSFDKYVKKQFPNAVHVRTPHLHHHHPQITQEFIRVTDEDIVNRASEVNSVLVRNEPSLIFVNTSEAATHFAQALRSIGTVCEEFHKGNHERSQALEAFRNKEVDILVCTDMAARGFDLPHVKHVIQAEFALNVVQYLHRVGRCSRGGVPGKATSFYDTRSDVLLHAINDVKGTESQSEHGTTAHWKTSSVDSAFSRRRGLRGKLKQQARKVRNALVDGTTLHT